LGPENFLWGRAYASGSIDQRTEKHPGWVGIRHLKKKATRIVEKIAEFERGGSMRDHLAWEAPDRAGANGRGDEYGG